MPTLLITFVCFCIFLILGIRFKKVIDPIVYYIFPVALIIYCIAFPSRDLFTFVGTLSKQLLIFLLLIKPIASILKSKTLFKVVAYRRQLGLITFWFFLTHTAGLIYLYNIFEISRYLTLKHSMGTLAGIGLLVLAITSNNYSMKLLEKNWKRVQYLVYPVLFGMLVHTSLNEYGNLIELYIIGALFIVLKGLEWKDISFRKHHETAETENEPTKPV